MAVKCFSVCPVVLPEERLDNPRVDDTTAAELVQYCRGWVKREERNSDEQFFLLKPPIRARHNSTEIMVIHQCRRKRVGPPSLLANSGGNIIAMDTKMNNTNYQAFSVIENTCQDYIVLLVGMRICA